MALLASCWLLVEFFIIPNGFLKWFYLSFYIHPIFLISCQIFLWLNELHKLFWFLYFSPFEIICFLSFFIFRFISKIANFLLSFTRRTKNEVFYDAMEQEITNNTCESVVVTYSTSLSYQDQETGYSSGVFEPGKKGEYGAHFCNSEEAMDEKSGWASCVKASWLNEYLYSDHFNGYLWRYYDDDDDDDDLDSVVYPNSLSEFKISGSSMDQEYANSFEDDEISLPDFVVRTSLSTTDDRCDLSVPDVLVVDDEHSRTACSSRSLTGESEPQLNNRCERGEIDLIHQKYTERMRFFEALYQERLFGLEAISNNDTTSPGLFESPESSIDFSMQHISWSKIARKRIMRSLECDLELIYVAQMCLSWEALHHQYTKVEPLITLNDHNSENRLFHYSVTAKFQEVQILLERFVEDQKFEGKKYSDYMHNRLSFQGQLRIPDVTGFMVQESNSKPGETIKASQVSKSIEKCIKAFWVYLKRDNKKSLWKYKGILRRTHPPVEDPRDLRLLYNVTAALHKKGIMLKDLQGKRMCWPIRRKVQGEQDKKTHIFAMIDMKLVQRLLKMPLISSSQLKWCQVKLNNLDFKQGELFRGTNSHLFPSS